MNFELPQFVSEILEKFTAAGFEIYIVGGSVRDLILGREIVDWDFTTNATPAQILEIFPDGFYDNKFGTVGIAHPSSKEPYEVTTFRKEIGYSDRRHPDKVVWGETIEQDLGRRELTINAMALHQTVQGEPLVIDLFDGQKDLKNKIIRAVGEADLRFAEDALRLIRAIRFATQLGFTIEEKTFAGIKNNAVLIKRISGERIRDELLKILASPHPADGITLLLSSGLLSEILPELEREYGVQQARHHKYDVWLHSLLSLKFCPSPDPLVRLATLLHDVGKPVVAKPDVAVGVTFYNHEIIGASIVRNIGRRLRLSKKQLDKLLTLVRWHQFTCDERQTDAAIRRFIRNVGQENLADMLALRIGDRLGGGAKETSWRLEKFKKRLVEVQKQPFAVKDLKVDGYEVMKILRINPGPTVGKILEQLFNEVVEKKIKNEKKVLLARIEKVKI
jgi:putative nucleotidyltransferase with HDIG domain